MAGGRWPATMGRFKQAARRNHTAVGASMGAEMGMEQVATKVSPTPTQGGGPNGVQKAMLTPAMTWCGYFQIPLHYPKYTKADYEAMPEWKLDCLLTEYGLSVSGDVEQKRNFAMGAFLWPC
ncbi:hypothetical protein V6N11_006422 [Hibiscus sabdariffa]|uniref:DUF7722 domain-containing protein n=1 Tax=Hibiscus sabdariffa TaxID=183260 RepID=A0ABR2RR78_9ROSI